MPNHVKNRLEIIGTTKEQVQKVLDKFSTENHFPDFNKVMPQPENIFNGNLGNEERKMCEEENRPNWYDWNIDNWGTKWNSYECERLNYNLFTFLTAWSTPIPIIHEMSKQFPEMEFILEFADEDIGCNTGYFKAINGNIIEGELYDNQSMEAYSLAFDLWPGAEEYYVLENGEYVHKD